MDTTTTSLAIHRLRFLPFAPSPPTSLAISPHPIAATGRGLLAVGRQNGDIDLCVWVKGGKGTDKGWIPHTTLVSSSTKPAKVESLAFAVTSSPNYGPNRLRLFSSSGGSNLLEHFLPEEFASLEARQGAIKRSITDNKVTGTSRSLSSHGGVIWCMAPSPLGRYIAIGCEDGHIRIVDIRQGRFEHVSLTNVERFADGTREITPRTDKAKSRIVSLAWGPPIVHETKKPARNTANNSNDSSDSDSDSDDDDDDDPDSSSRRESLILAGTASSHALLFPISTGRASQRLLLPKGRTEQTIVWSSAVLSDGTLITGDSLGFVTFYDAKTKVPLPDARFQVHERGADVLCLTVGTDGRTVYSGSVDQKVAEFTFIAGKWAHVATRRLHAHDVKALVIDPAPSVRTAANKGSASAVTPILVSASADYNVVLTPASPPSQMSVKKGGNKARQLEAAGAVNPVSSNPITTFASTTQRRVPYVPSSSSGSSLAGSGAGSVTLCASKGWAVSRSASTIEVWEMRPPASPEVGIGSLTLQPQSLPADQPPYIRLLQMEMTKRRSALIAHAISPSGRWLAVSDLRETKLYSLKSLGGDLQPKRSKAFTAAFASLEQEGAAAPAASVINFTPDGRLVMASWPDSKVYVVSLDEDRCQVVKVWEGAKAVKGGRAVVGRTAKPADDSGDESDASDSHSDSSSSSAPAPRIDHLLPTPDSQYLLCVSGIHLWSYNLDLLSPTARVLPSLPARAVGVAAHPNKPSAVIAALQSGEVRTLHLDETMSGGKGDALWEHLRKGVEAKLAGIRDAPTGVCWVPRNAAEGGAILVVYGATWLLTARETGHNGGLVNGNGVNGHKRRSNGSGLAEGDGSGNGDGDLGFPYWVVRLTHRYQPIAAVGPLRVAEDGQAEETAGMGLGVVEKPIFGLVQGMDKAWKRQRRYGC
ncbi:hypothetical protein BDZ90DRAFT_278841 [Jaminaea rosea]|uniref:Uncharacterized protein n=1 Tax=Jaminaea rosea TaxID=1569628 RepID=A0A316UUL2_9BASI|nr:hypothetical protein BDZ90DRAFT_278841 [Jaminaea rosea]PWN28478.1 hypothetical protein BDZ90DRAFT_278841 [Jaminaea rosea]